MTNPLELLKDAKLAKEIAFVDDYKKYLDPSLYKNHLTENIDHILFVIDFRSQKLVYLSDNTLSVCGYEYEEMISAGPMFLYSIAHPKDLEILIKHIFTSFSEFFVSNNLGNKDLSKLKFSYTHRIRQKNGSYKFVVNRYSNIIVGENGMPLVIIGTTSDISEFYHKKEVYGEIVEHFTNKAPQKLLFRNFPTQEETNDLKISKKELEILLLVTKGMISKEIAAYTNRSIETIHSHRKNILKKLNCNNFTDAVIIAKENNWI